MSAQIFTYETIQVEDIREAEVVYIDNAKFSPLLKWHFKINEDLFISLKDIRSSICKYNDESFSSIYNTFDIISELVCKKPIKKK